MQTRKKVNLTELTMSIVFNLFIRTLNCQETNQLNTVLINSSF